MSHKVLVLSDNPYLTDEFKKILDKRNIENEFVFCTSSTGKATHKHEHENTINLKNSEQYLLDNFNLIISLHCKQIFPKNIVKNIRCVNIHPGYNPYNRGWYPQVFSIINKFPVGVTIHEMDEEIDHGAIIVQEEIPIFSDDDSLSVYQRILHKEIDMLDKHIIEILNHTYTTTSPLSEGNYNGIRDFNKICHLNLNETLTMKQAIDKLRALTHGDFKNAFFLNENGEKVYVKLALQKEQQMA
jgi:methionyl-tRNA formyltransferase